MEKTSVLENRAVKFLIAVGGIYTSYIYYSIVLEKMYTKDYSGFDRPRGSYERFSYGFSTFLFQNVFSFILAGIVNKYCYSQSKSKMDFRSEIVISFTSFVSVYLTSFALSHVSFPLQAIIKSSKTISILAVSLVLGLKNQHTRSQYFCGVIITIGIVMFNLNQGSAKHSDQGSSFIGLAAIAVALFCDGLLGVKQAEVKKKYQPSSWDMMESLNKWSVVMCLFVAVATNQMMGFIQFTRDYPAVIPDLVMVSILGTMGQVFIFYTLGNFSPLILSIITTTRKFFTVLASILIFGHEVSIIQWLSIGLVFLGVSIETFGGKNKGKQEEEKPAKLENGKLRSSQANQNGKSHEKKEKKEKKNENGAKKSGKSKNHEKENGVKKVNQKQADRNQAQQNGKESKKKKKVNSKYD